MPYALGWLSLMSSCAADESYTGLLTVALMGGLGLLVALGWQFWRTQKQLQQTQAALQKSEEQLQWHRTQLAKQQERVLQQQNDLLHKEKIMDAYLKESLEIRQELTQLNQSLEKKVQERTQELQTTLDTLIRADAELDNFVYKASHDLRSPIARMQGLVTIARMEQANPQQMADYLNKIEMIAFDMDNMLSKLLAINVINIDQLQKKRIDFEELARKVVSDLESKHINSPVKIQVHVGEIGDFYSDSRVIEIILTNLIENALLYYRAIVEEPPYVAVDIGQHKDHLRIIVQDNGTGIMEDHINQVFDMFFKGSDRSKGNGLGLYAVRKASEKLGGTVSVESEQGDYTKIVVRLPYHPSNHVLLRRKEMLM
ncbi:MAG: ATP-binding protein [Bernardetiaceae bacterium]